MNYVVLLVITDLFNCGWIHHSLIQHGAFTKGFSAHKAITLGNLTLNAKDARKYPICFQNSYSIKAKFRN
jgi:hypothetical protein